MDLIIAYTPLVEPFSSGPSITWFNVFLKIPEYSELTLYIYLAQQSISTWYLSNLENLFSAYFVCSKALTGMKK